MRQPKFKIGSKVRPKSGGPVMTVIALQGPDAVLVDRVLDDGANERATYEIATLTGVSVHA